MAPAKLSLRVRVGAVWSTLTLVLCTAALPAWSVLVTLTVYTPSGSADRLADRFLGVAALLLLQLTPDTTAPAVLVTSTLIAGLAVTASLLA